MRVVATFHQPSSVVSSARCSLTADQEFLVVGKTNRIEVFSLQADGLRKECSLEIWGRVVAVKALPVGDTSKILVLTDHPDPRLIVLGYTTDGEGRPSLVSKHYVELHDRYARPAEFVTDVLVHSSGRIAVVNCYTGKLKLIKFREGKKPEVMDVSIPELYIVALTFLQTESDSYALGILHFNHQRQLQLLSRDIDLDNYEISPTPSVTIRSCILPSSTFPETESPPLLVPVPPYASPEAEDDEYDDEEDSRRSHRGGVLVLGGRKILFIEHESREQQEVKRGKQRRVSERLSSGDSKQMLKAKEKEKERDARKAKPRLRVNWPWSEITACCPVDPDGRRFLIGDTYGRLTMLAFTDPPSLLVVPLGSTSPATSLTYLTSQVLFVGSHFGEPQLLRVSPTPVSDVDADTLPVPKGVATVEPAALSAGSSAAKGKGRADRDWDMEAREAREGKDGKVVSTKGSYVEAVDRWENVAPIVDAAMADLEGSGQPQIITCSGGRNSGSLKVIRTGADFQERAVVEGLANVTNIWAIRSRFEDTVDSHIIASTLEETYVFRFDSAESITRLDPSTDGLLASVPTLAIKNIPRRTTAGGKSAYVDSSLVVQVTPQKLRLVEYDKALGLFSLVSEGWDAQKEGRSIVAADLNASQVVLGLGRGRLALYNLSDSRQFQLLKHRDFADATYGPLEIAAVSCAPFDPTKNYATMIAVSFWGTNRVALLSLNTAETYLSTLCEVGVPSLPRSLLLHNFGASRSRKEPDFRPHLLAGLADGSVVSFGIREKEGALAEQKQFSLGTAPVSFTTCVVDGRKAVLASGSRASVMYWDRQRLNQSPVMLKEPVVAASINSSAYPSCLVLGTPSSLLIGNVRGVDKMQIKTVPLGLENPRRISHHAQFKAFIIACTRTTPPRIGDAEDMISSLKVLDDTTFNPLASFACEPGEEITATLALSGGDEHPSPCSICIGTVEFQVDEREPSAGRIILFSLDTSAGSAPTLRMLASRDVGGCVYQLVNIRGMIAAAVNTSVILFKTETINDSTLQLRKVSEWNHNYIVTSLVCKGRTLVVGDAISSVSVLSLDNNGQLQCKARDYAPVWPVAVETIGNGGVIGANSDCNLFTFARSSDRTTLERDGSYHIGDVVNKFIPGGLGSADLTNNLLESKLVFFTSAGRIGVVFEMSDDISLHMTALQRNMAKHIIGPGNTFHPKWRAPANSRGHTDAEAAFGFLDGDFLEHYLSVPDPHKFLAGDNEAERISIPGPQIQDVLEKLQSLH
ncbi:mono-functional DNA-alkylating methyl methanesulfonate N-term-domain-containing protein [Rhodofomes roseus]|uniref:Mono-functional DNA-alkylating methyl methanesulfonate N-term-domain-containing protein n=1 Tax=Rhodofomes roseus TaxID=34475 RepID=A0ABQ8KSS2_9APHY|nr:mono-functional DNA-alkylating methyl methanesulfonate N-term-domain-containing protein [Rhodofomes roseus]KAH9841501.1 mono-functional DNA-alkylating methyl methanesulfonate N-term-domain-containing protein [Rhodofomes roseus]